jgi:hypothetical protein
LRILFCLFAALTISACETMPSYGQKSIEVQTSQTSEATMPMMTPTQTIGPKDAHGIPHCERFEGSLAQAEQKIASNNFDVF